MSGYEHIHLQEQAGLLHSFDDYAAATYALSVHLLLKRVYLSLKESEAN